MLLPTQIQAILFHFLMGWVYALGFSFLITFLKYIWSSFVRGIVEILYHIVFTLLMFYGLYKINGGVTNIYLIAFFLSGVLIYYTFYLAVFLDFYAGIKRFLRPIRKKLSLVKRKILAIIRVPRNRIRRRRADAKKRKRAKAERKSKKEKEKTSSQVVL